MASIKDIARSFADIYRVDVGVRGSEPTVEVSRGELPDDPRGGTFGSWLSWLRKELEIDPRFGNAIKDYKEMDSYSEVSIALDTYADEATQPDPETGRSIWVSGSNNTQVKRIEELFSDVIRVEECIWSLSRNTGQFGNDFNRIMQETGKGVTGLTSIDLTEVKPIMDTLGRLVGYKMTKEEGNASGRNVPIAKPWDYAHFRIYGKNRRDMLGDSMCEAARGVWKRLKMLEEAVAIYRLQRAPDRLIYTIDVGDDTGPLEGLNIAREYQKRMKKRVYVDPSTNELKVGTSPAAMDTDIFWPTRRNSNSRVERLPGGADITSIVDIDLQLNKLYRALRLPRDYVGGESIGGVFDLSRGLARQDMRVARFVRRLQRAVIQGFTEIAQIHLALINVDVNPKTFRIEMSAILAEDEIREGQLLGDKIRSSDEMNRLFGELGIDQKIATPYILNRVLDLDEKEMKELGIDIPEGIDIRKLPSIIQERAQHSRSARYASDGVKAMIEDLIEETKPSSNGQAQLDLRPASPEEVVA